MPFVKSSVTDGIALVAIDNPPANVLTQETFAAVAEALSTHIKDPAVRGIVLTGEGANFAAGADVKAIAGIADAKEGERLSLEAHKLASAIENSSVPVIAAINGYCFGGGCELVLACHMRIANDKARIAQPEIKVGIIPGMGGSVRLPRLIGRAKAIEMLLTGEPISAQEAHRVGLVNMVVPEADLRRQATGLAKRIATMGKPAVSRILQSVRDGLSMTVSDHIKLEAKLFGEIAVTEDKKEGIAAFVEKRPPVFRDR